mmetsp:Transcript_22097/g.68345  ORF Transcript_22097/g.68345 Transcript_22097/m.68345 type:complete len:204 (-) Transcript_22097:1405-2016(-)
MSLYWSNVPLYTKTRPGLPPSPLCTHHSSSQVSEIRRSSWLTSTTPPSKELIAMASASMVSKSRWLVGSSSSRMCGSLYASSAKASRLFCPPLRFLIGLVASCPESPNRPRNARASSSGISSSRRRMCVTASASVSMFSTLCCENIARRSLQCRLTQPSLGIRSPRMSLRKVDLPAPFGPTIATRLSQSRPKSSFSYNVRPGS